MAKLKKENLSDLVYKQIGSMIKNRDLVPGEKINRKDLAKIIGVSQTPVNEAIIKFVNEGVVEQRERQGFYLKLFTDKDMKDLFAVRAGLEGVALRMCIEEREAECLKDVLTAFDGFSNPLSEEEYKKYSEADRMFHEKILTTSGNQVIIDFIRNFDFILKCYQKGLIRSPEETLDEHRDIIAAIVAKDADKAQNLLMSHHLKTKNFITEKHIQ
ncbi:MAG: GntR family transcriptional regulator [Spirochaetales bacterium]|nr:GntR family transcriptional regulator [Spirochaetales bacterium]